jgi:Mitochondrial carrier protein
MTESETTSSPSNNELRSLKKRRLTTEIIQVQHNHQQSSSSSPSSSSSSFASPASVRSSLIAGSCAGIASTICLYPMDVLRTKLQQQQSMSQYGPWYVFRTTIQHGGIRALYTGITMPLLAQTVYKSTVFTVSNITQQFLIDYRTYQYSTHGITTSNTTTKSTLMDRFWGGFVGGAVNAALFVTPVEFIRNQLIANHTQLSSNNTTSSGYKEVTTNASKYQTLSTLEVIKHSIRQEKGILSLWRGTSWSIYRDSIGCGCFFYTMAYCQQYFSSASSSMTTDGETPTTKTKTPTLTATIISGGVAGLAYWVSALPLDTIKTWVQSSDVTAKPLSASKTIQTIYNEHGLIELFIRLFRGWQVAYIRGIPSAAITMTTYSLVYRYVSDGNDSFT